MTSKIVVNNIEADAGVSTVTFNSNVERGSSNLHSTGLNVNDTFVHSTGIALGAGSTVGAVTGVTTYYGDGSQLTGISAGGTKIETGNTKVETIDTGSDGHIKATTEGSERLRIASDGHIFVANEAGTIDTTARLGEGHRLQLSGLSSNDGISVIRYNSGYGAWGLNLGRSRSNTLGTNTVLSNNDDIGHVTFWGADGSDFEKAAQISAQVDGTPSDGTDMPGRLVFKTSTDGSNNPSEKMVIKADGNVKFNHGLTGLVGGGVIVAAAKSSSGTANQSNYKVDFTVPMGDLGNNHEYNDIRAQFSSGQTGKDWTHALGGSGILIATVQNNYYWGYRTKIYHITTYGNSSNNVTSLNLLHNYSAAGHGSNSASVDLAVQSHNGKTPKLRATFSGDYWNSNVLTVTFIGSSVASTGNIRQLTSFDSALTGQDPAWK